MAERKPKRQRFSLGGPAVDTSFEDYLTGSTKHISSDEEEEEEFDQENQDPEDDEPEEYPSDQDEDEPEPIRPAPTTSAAPPPPIRPAPPPPITNPKDLVNKIHSHQWHTKSSTAKDIYYLLHVRCIEPDFPVVVTRLLRIPAILLFEQLSEAIIAAFDWSGGHLWKFSLETPPTSSVLLSKNKFPIQDREVCNIRDSGVNGMHSLGTVNHSKDLDSKKVRVMEVWGHAQIPEVRRLRMFYTYDCYGDPWYLSVTFMGVAEQGLQAADLGLQVNDRQPVLCVSGSGVMYPEDMPEDELEKWEQETNKHEWSIEEVNEQLAEIVIRDVSSYRHDLPRKK
ncbi:hypothetical protein E4T44_03772 [Aureobasidium sp. EXF-8845]|nr:hypothetical protein E4T44_03772 [Aureobasidium sp. EXF-8845]KAI4854752.1 hypothetical protein E4T45_03822 [Aureobasidium sp. EXF-8846]